MLKGFMNTLTRTSLCGHHRPNRAQVVVHGCPIAKANWPESMTMYSDGQTMGPVKHLFTSPLSLFSGVFLTVSVIGKFDV